MQKNIQNLKNIYKSKKLVSANGLYKNLKSYIEFVKIKQGYLYAFLIKTCHMAML